MSGFLARTDLALEARESIGDVKGEHRGIRVEEQFDKENDIRVTKVMIDTKNAAKDMGKPIGIYITIEAPAMLDGDDDYHREISEELAKQLKLIIPEKDKEQSILVVGLGNRDVTADALGPHVTDNLFITRHVVLEYGKMAYGKSKMHMISSIEPGVMGKTGMEAAEIIRGIVEQTAPDAVIAIDALASRSTKRLNRTIQITDTGIQPGSGVGNHRNALTKESMGIPVIAIGVPTVVDAATIVVDAMEQLCENDKASFGEKENFRFRKSFSELNNMYVTSKDIDAVIKRVSYTLSEGINLALEME